MTPGQSTERPLKLWNLTNDFTCYCVSADERHEWLYPAVCPSIAKKNTRQLGDSVWLWGTVHPQLFTVETKTMLGGNFRSSSSTNTLTSVSFFSLLMIVMTTCLTTLLNTCILWVSVCCLLCSVCVMMLTWHRTLLFTFSCLWLFLCEALWSTLVVFRCPLPTCPDLSWAELGSDGGRSVAGEQQHETVM